MHQNGTQDIPKICFDKKIPTISGVSARGGRYFSLNKCQFFYACMTKINAHLFFDVKPICKGDFYTPMLSRVDFVSVSVCFLCF